MSECKAELHIGDDYGDNIATMRCQHQEGHEGCHVEKYSNDNGDLRLISWEGDDREEKVDTDNANK